ncbi:Hypothetical_protein [Hexamita inflata]|uniref:Hypothetical_protein n=1 Tax=Hexamita inflata TaxID=28002 RepID=A0AA86UAP4_9EUKA|nr:Hypothetical protein HINF_LOCUS31502 [Hexamita inflata]
MQLISHPTDFCTVTGFICSVFRGTWDDISQFQVTCVEMRITTLEREAITISKYIFVSIFLWNTLYLRQDINCFLTSILSYYLRLLELGHHQLLFKTLNINFGSAQTQQYHNCPEFFDMLNNYQTSWKQENRLSVILGRKSAHRICFCVASRELKHKKSHINILMGYNLSLTYLSTNRLLGYCQLRYHYKFVT